MKISNVRAVLTEEDILSIVKDYVKIEGLTFSSLEINDLIYVTGCYKKGITIPFKAAVGIGNIYDNKINVKIFDIKIAKVGVFGGIKNFALKTFLKDFEEYGIKADKDYMEIDVNMISKLVPYVYFNLKSVKIVNNTIEAEVCDVVYAEHKEAIKIEKKKPVSPNKAEDGYDKLRKNIEEKVPERYEKVIQYAMLIPDITVLLWRLFKDKRVNKKVKLKVAGVAAYLACPIDIFPGFIPLIGRVDDIAVAFFGLNSIINDVPVEIILENWQGEEDIIKMVKEAVDYISKAAGAQNVSKVVDFIKNIGKEKKTQEVDDNEERSNLH